MVDEVMDIAGIDYSTHYVDIVRLGDDHAPVWNRYPLYGADSFDRARSIRPCVPSSGSSYWDNVLAVGIEEPAGRNTGHLFRIQGAVLSQIPGRMLVEKWMPSQWRKAVGLPGNCSKGVVAEAVYVWRAQAAGTFVDEKVTELGIRIRRYSVDTWPQDACDAYCIALATQKALDRQAA